MGTRHPMDAVREAVRAGEVTVAALAREAGRHRSTVGRAVAGAIDVPESTSREYARALERVRGKGQGKGKDEG